jgi:dienelactone hydrolase
LAAERDRRQHAHRRERERRRRQLARRRAVALSSALIGAAAIAALIAFVVVPALSGGGHARSHRTRTTVEATSSSTTAPPAPGPPFAVGVRTMRFVDGSRTVHYADGATGPRVLNTEVRYPASGRGGERAIPNASPQQASGPFPLIVFGHGFELLPVDYWRLMNAWARAGYVVAAPIFPDENHDAPGGPDENDLVNQPEDMKFVISQMQAADRAPTGPFSGLIDATQVAVAGHSDGGDTALAVAYDESEGVRDPQVKAAVILAGAEIPYLPAFAFPGGGPPLLAVQGTADLVNHPSDTAAYFQAASTPKYLLQLFGAEHLPPYTVQEPQLSIVERVSVDFLNRYLKQRAGSLAAMSAAGNVPRVAGLQADR